MLNELTVKQKKFTQALVENPDRSIAEAGRLAGYCDRQQFKIS